MTIKELIAELSKYDQNLEVAFAWDGGLSNPEDFEVVEEQGTKVLVGQVIFDSWGNFGTRK